MDKSARSDNKGSLPVNLVWSADELLLRCRLKFNKRAVQTGLGGLSYADLFCAGIKQHWSGSYEEDQKKITLRLELVQTMQKPYVRVLVKPSLFMPAHVVSPFYRRIWGIFCTGQLESMGLFWSPRQPGRIILPPYKNADTFKRIAAHEMGHIFGLGDAYAAFYRFYHAVPGTQSYMMHSNGQVQPEEIRLLLKAQESGRMQYFPRAWHTPTVLKGIGRDLAYLAQSLVRAVRSIWQKN